MASRDWDALSGACGPVNCRLAINVYTMCGLYLHRAGATRLQLRCALVNNTFRAKLLIVC